MTERISVREISHNFQRGRTIPNFAQSGENERDRRVADPFTPPKLTPLNFRVPSIRTKALSRVTCSPQCFAAPLGSQRGRGPKPACQQASSETRTVNQFSAVVPPTIDSA